MKPEHPAGLAPAACHSTTLLGQPAALVASVEFNEHPQPLAIAGTIEANQGLFAMLERTDTPGQAAACFQDYMDVLFGFEPEQRRGVDASGRRRFRSSYLRLLKGWGFDANGREAAVLKGWVESRFGLMPGFHKMRIDSFSSRAWIGYVEEKMASRFHNNSINMQLDLLYEFCQWTLARFHAHGRRHLRLYRGTNDFAEHPVVEYIDKRHAVIRLNNLVSFTSNRNIACEFGDYILEVAVPCVKVLFFNDMLPRHALHGEAEYLVVGGDYRVLVSTL